jgi:sporulation protein YlmC with PRC-barrel domain
MLQLSTSLLNKPVLSLRTGQPIAQVSSTLINPNNLKIEGFYCTDRFNAKSMILLYQDIREFIDKGYVVNDHDALSEPHDLIRLADIIKINFKLIGKPVVTISKEKVGKVSDYAVETQTMYIQKIYVSQSLLKNFSGGSLSVDRNNINEITDKKVIINDLLKNSPVTAPATA